MKVYVIAPQRERDGNMWQLVGKEKGAKTQYRSAKTADRAEAEEIARAWEAAHNGLTAALPPRSTVAALLDKYRGVRESDGETPEGTLRTYRTAFKRVRPLLGTLSVEDFDGPALAKVRDGLLAADLDGKTVNVTISRVRAAWRWALELGHVKAPWPAIRGARAQRTKKRPMRPAEFAALLRWAATYTQSPWARRFFSTAADTGARSGDVLALDGRHVDRARRRVWVYDAKKKEHRWSGVTAHTIALLPNVGPDEPLFAGTKGRVQPQTALKVFRRGVAAIGIPDADRLDVHSLRRTNAKEADRTGVPSGIGMKQRGHVNPSMSAHYQADPDDDEDMAAVADQLASRWTPLLDPPTTPHLNASNRQAEAVQPQLAGSIRITGKSRRSKRGNGAGGSTPIQPGARTTANAGERAPLLAGGDAVMLADPHAQTYARWWDDDPEAMAALLFTAWRLRRLSDAVTDERPDLVKPEAAPVKKGKKVHRA